MTQTSFAAVVGLIQANAFLEARFSSELASVHGLGLKEALLLMHLERAPLQRLTRVDIAKRLHLNPSTVTRMALPLEKIGLVERQADARDARLAYVALTGAAKAIVQDVRATFERRSADLFKDRWSEAEIATFASLLGRLSANTPSDLAE